MHNPTLSAAATITVWTNTVLESATAFARQAGDRLHNEEDGQTAAEYLGIIVLIATIFAAIFALELHTTIADKIGDLINDIASGKPAAKKEG